MSGVEAMIKQAEASLGMGEPNKIQAWYPGLSGNFAWCNAAVTYWAWHSGNQGAVTFGGYYAYTVAHAQKFKNMGQWHTDIAGIRRGDIVFFDWAFSNSIGAIDHVGIVTSVSGGTVYTIEGNTANVCARRVRGASTIAGYGRPKYVNPAPAPVLPAVSLKAVAYALQHRASLEPLSGKDDMKRVQAALVKVGKLKAGGYVAGIGGTTTRTAYSLYQRSLGYTGVDADGVPGTDSLTKLGAASKLFRVVA